MRPVQNLFTCRLSFFMLKYIEVHVRRAHAPPPVSSHRWELLLACKVLDQVPDGSVIWGNSKFSDFIQCSGS